tara:strand:+ start:95 stop:670 length:576 start_codon:yes stop_codon:yes gene_type:complete
MACTVDIKYKPVGGIGSFTNIDNYSKTGQFKVKIEVWVGCAGSCPDPEIPCPPILLRKTKEVTFDLEDSMPPAEDGGGRKTLDRIKDDHEKQKNATFKYELRQDFKAECRKFGKGVTGGYSTVAGDQDYGTKTLAELSDEYGIDLVNKLKKKAKFTNLCDCDVTTTTVLSVKVLDHIVDEVEKDLFISRNP